MKQDQLFKIFIEQLHCTKNSAETAPDFIKKVASFYTMELMRMGSIPFQLLDDVIMDVEAELIEMYRKKTYGFLSLQEYRKNLDPQSRKKNLAKE